MQMRFRQASGGARGSFSSNDMSTPMRRMRLLCCARPERPSRRAAEHSVDACLAQEMSARDQLANEWERFSSADRSSCTSVATIGGGGSYTALLSCLEMKRDARNLSQGKASVLIAGH